MDVIKKPAIQISERGVRLVRLGEIFSRHRETNRSFRSRRPTGQPRRATRRLRARCLPACVRSLPLPAAGFAPLGPALQIARPPRFALPHCPDVVPCLPTATPAVHPSNRHGIFARRRPAHRTRRPRGARHAAPSLPGSLGSHRRRGRGARRAAATEQHRPAAGATGTPRALQLLARPGGRRCVLAPSSTTKCTRSIWAKARCSSRTCPTCSNSPRPSPCPRRSRRAPTRRARPDGSTCSRASSPRRARRSMRSPPGFRGRLFVHVISRSFPIRLRTGDKLVQLRGVEG